MEGENIKISFLEREIKRLTNLIREQKDKVIEAYLFFFAEKKLLQQLVVAHLDYKKAPKEQKNKLRKHREILYNKLEEKISEEQIAEVEIILEDCEKLLHYETELQIKINQNQKLIESSQSTIQSITYNINYINIGQGHALIGNKMGNEMNLGYQLQSALETKIEIPPKSN